MKRPNTLAQDIKEITGAIYGMAGIMDADLCRDANEGEESNLNAFDQGCMLAAMKHLANLASWMAEEIEENEQRMAEIAAQGDDREGEP